MELILSYPAPPRSEAIPGVIRIKLKDKAGPFGVHRALVDVKAGDSTSLQVDAGNRLTFWFIDTNEKMRPGTRKCKHTIEAVTIRNYNKQAFIMAPYLGQQVMLRQDDRATVRKSG